MKKITIGRGRECDVRLSDSTDKVSRRQAVITFSPTGKMMIYDTSSNGTFVNGERVEKPAGKPIKRGDNVNFAHLVDLDWDTVKNPYKPVWIWTSSILVVIIAAFIVCWFWGAAIMGNFSSSNTPATTVVTDSISPVNDSLKLETTQTKTVGTVKEPAKTKTKPSTGDDKKTKPALPPGKPHTKPINQAPEFGQTGKENPPAKESPAPKDNSQHDLNKIRDEK